jgi:hypothetical protein
MLWLAISIAFQLFCVVHCLRNGRHAAWILGILLFSLLGCAAYFIVEILPGLQRDRRVQKASAQIADRIDPDRNLRTAREKLDLSDTITTRLAMGDALAGKGQHGDALGHYLEARAKSRMADPAVEMRLASAYLELGRADAALEAIAALPEGGTQIDRDKREVLRARLLEQQGDLKAALEIYEEVMDRASGDEVRCRAANARMQLGDRVGARALFTVVEQRMRHLPKATIAEDAEMYRWAMKTLAELRA